MPKIVFILRWNLNSTPNLSSLPATVVLRGRAASAVWYGWTAIWVMDGTGTPGKVTAVAAIGGWGPVATENGYWAPIKAGCIPWEDKQMLLKPAWYAFLESYTCHWKIKSHKIKLNQGHSCKDHYTCINKLIWVSLHLYSASNITLCINDCQVSVCISA